MRNSWMIILLLIGLFACTLSAHQEETLNRSVTRFMEAKRKGVTLAYVSMIQPDFVRYYQEQGDSLFKKKFTTEEASEYSLDDATLQSTAKDGDRIQVWYKAKVIGYYFENPKESEQVFVACSEDNGETWLFVEGEEYFDHKIVPNFKRLIEEK